jgi:hypothetical protein
MQRVGLKALTTQLSLPEVRERWVAERRRIQTSNRHAAFDQARFQGANVQSLDLDATQGPGADRQAAADRTRSWAGENPFALLSSHANQCGSPEMFNMSVSLIKDGKMPSWCDPASPDYCGKEVTAQILRDYAADSRTYTACHDVAAQLGHIFGDGAGTVLGGTGGERTAALRQAADALAVDDPHVVNIRHRDPRRDGHSFTLINTGCGTEVAPMEAWAVNSSSQTNSGDFCSLLRRSHHIDRDAAMAALGQLASTDHLQRDQGLQTLSKAGGRLAFESLNQSPDEVETTVTIRPLAAPREAQMRLRDRWQVLNAALRAHGVTLPDPRSQFRPASV